MDTITLEMSLKPFKKVDDEYIQKVCSQIFEHWMPLINYVPEVQILIWAADGSELFDYRGNLSDTFEWCYWIGLANHCSQDWLSSADPNATSLSSRAHKYIDNPPVMTYAVLKNIISALKDEFYCRWSNKVINIGTTVDVGPEFAKSSFKYERHTEIVTGEGGKFINAANKMNGDDYHYAAFPNGVPEGTPFGTFLGRQASVYMRDMGFDYIWTSNGIGFGNDPWSAHGVLFDGEKFDFSNIEQVKRNNMEFWNLFTKECKYPIEPRGTNMSVGVDMSTEGVSLKEIYSIKNITGTPNSPWASIDGDFGLELMGHMSRIAEIPDNGFMFRYYIHDPWWANSPWYDRYNSNPHDIYLPMSIARIDKDGKMQSPNKMNVLTIDNSFGDMPDACVYEPLPHLMKAIKETSDRPSPYVWVYPFDEYCSCSTESYAKEMFSNDWFVSGIINNGFPLSSVTSTSNFITHDKSIYASSIVVTPVPLKGSEFEKTIMEYAVGGGKVIFYGNTKNAGENFKKFIGIKDADDITGEFELIVDGAKVGKINCSAITSGGGLNAVSERNNVFAKTENRVLGIKERNFAWVRAVGSSVLTQNNNRPNSLDEENFFIFETIMTHLSSYFGYDIMYERRNIEKLPVFMLHRHNNAFIFSLYHPCTTVKTKFKFPYGAPILDNYDVNLENGCATYYFPKAERKECRVFVEQNDGIVSCKESAPVSVLYRRVIDIYGLKNANVRIFGENYCKSKLEFNLNPPWSDSYSVSDDVDSKVVTENGETYVLVKNVTGRLRVLMPYKEKRYKF